MDSYPQIGEIWEVRKPFIWHQKRVEAGYSTEFFQEGDKFLIEGVSPAVYPEIPGNGLAFLRWVSFQGWCYIHHLPTYCTRLIIPATGND